MEDEGVLYEKKEEEEEKRKLASVLHTKVNYKIVQIYDLIAK